MRVEKWCQVGWNVLVGSVVMLALGCGGEDAVAPTTGSLEVTTTTSGPDPDVDGYTVSIDGGAEVALGADATLRRDDLGAGEHSIRLSGVAGNCTVEGPNPRTITVPAGEATSVAFAVSCTAPTTGTLTITTTTTGSNPDPDGYTASVDGGGEQLIETSATLTISTLVTGTHTVELAGLASNCQIAGDNPRTVVITAGATTNTTFTVTCSPRQSTKILFRRIQDGSSEIFVVNTDGSAQTNLTLNAAFDCCGSWSPDGQKIAFASTRDDENGDIYVMNADGSGVTNLTNTPNIGEGFPRWSPDGQKIAFVSSRDEKAGIYVMNADGTGVTRLTSNPTPDYNQEWSPDGTRIAFLRDGRIFVMNADGSGQIPLTSSSGGESDRDHHWSPDGSKIAFIREGLYGAHDPAHIENVWVMNADGGSPRSITAVPEEDGRDIFVYGNSWAPDGSHITFASNLESFPEDIYMVRPDGGGLINLTNSDDRGEESPQWSPDGAHILFSALVGDQPDLFVMKSDGSHVINVSNSPAHDAEGEWQP
jgi:Tol biopolymer transport system component